MLYREIGMVTANIARWIGGITDFLPMADDDVESLRTVALHDSRTWRQLREIEQRGHLAGVTPRPGRALRHGRRHRPGGGRRRRPAAFDPAQRFNFLHLLNEDLYKGQLTDELFEAQRKSPAGP